MTIGDKRMSQEDDEYHRERALRDKAYNEGIADYKLRLQQIKNTHDSDPEEISSEQFIYQSEAIDIAKELEK